MAIIIVIITKKFTPMIMNNSYQTNQVNTSTQRIKVLLEPIVPTIISEQSQDPIP